jgi:hypothetical protein
MNGWSCPNHNYTHDSPAPESASAWPKHPENARASTLPEVEHCLGNLAVAASRLIASPA